MSSMEDTATLASLFLLPDTIAVEAVHPTKSRLTLQISCPPHALPGSSSASQRSLTRNNTNTLSKYARAIPIWR